MGDHSFGSDFKSILQLILERFASLGSSLGPKEIRLIWDVEEEVGRLQRTLYKIRQLLNHVKVSSLRIYGGNRSDPWQVLLDKLRKLDYDAEALIDHIFLKLSTYCTRRSTSSNQEGQLRAMILSSFRTLNLPNQIAAMQSSLDELVIETERLVKIEQITHVDDTGRSGVCTYSFKEPSFVVGRDTDIEYIANFLCSETTSANNYSVISVVGMCGIGKTTVARCAFNNANFDRKIWISLSEEFDAIKITRSMIEFASLSACHLADLGSLQRKLQNIIRGRKFLIVLDNYSSDSCDEWDALCGPFQSGFKGSKIIVTSRNMKVSRVCSDQEHILQLLSDDNCLEVIQKSSKLSGESRENLKSIGIEIAKKCRGLPLVATALGQLLRCKCTEEDWRLVLEEDLWKILEKQNIFFQLIQTYVHLPTYLQKCFGYCSIFPEGYEFEIEELLSLWIAEGFIEAPQSFRRAVAKDHFHELYMRFLFQRSTNASNQMRYKMHNLMHGMAQLVSRNLCFRAKHGAYPLFGYACHLSLLLDGIQEFRLEASVKNQRLRTFLVMNCSTDTDTSTTIHPHTFSYLKFLKVLGLAGIGLSELHCSIKLLQYLRYLNLSNNPISELPESLCTILSLEILKLRDCPNLDKFPGEMSSLINLMHLEFDEREFRIMSPHFSKLVKLEILSAYAVGKEKGYGIGELKSLNWLGGRLIIRNIEKSKPTDAREANLHLKIKLEKLELEWTCMGLYDSQSSLEQDAVLAELRPHVNLKELVISCFIGMIYPCWLGDASNRFTRISLKGLQYCDKLPCLGELPCLTFFSISDMPCLEVINHEFYGLNNGVKFPSLKSFELICLSRLTHWEETNGNNNVMPCLKNFTVDKCLELFRLPENVQTLLPVSVVTECPKLQP